MVATVVVRPARARTLAKVVLASQTLNVIQEDVSRAWTEVSLSRGCNGPSTPQLSAHHLGFIQVPEVITHGAPGPLVEDLHAS